MAGSAWKFFYNFEKTCKSGFNIDFLFKNFILYIYAKITNKNFLFISDKYFVEYIYYKFKSFFNYFFIISSIVKNLNFNQLIKLILLISIQLIILIIL